ncbi:MAG: hypothetical protein NTY34_08440 [Candidatus Omnitrophica bacterium]|nr:hypothetical protein [Candidatus Omnitrophota bacterium]
MNRKGSRKKGFVLIYVIIAIILASILASALYTSVFLSHRLFMRQQENKLAYYVAISGVEYASYIIRSGHYNPLVPDGNPPITPAWPLGSSFDPTVGTSIAVTITSDGAPPVYTITSVATFSGTTKTLIVTCTSSGRITSWKTS